MSSPQSVDPRVTAVPGTQFVVDDNPLSKLFFDHRTSAGYRLMAVAEPVHHTQHGYLTAGTALAAFEEALLIAVGAGAEDGLRRAFEAANSAVRAANAATPHPSRTYAGITAAVVIGSEAVIGTVPPGQALLIQDSRLYGIPELSSWSANFMPADGAALPEPLGLAATVLPHLRKTTVGIGDEIVIGSSAVGRVLARREFASGATVESDELVQTVEQALEASNIDEAFAAWMRFDALSSPDLSPEQIARFERTWCPQPVADAAETVVQDNNVAHLAGNSRYRRTIKADRIHVRLIEFSERLLGGNGPGPLPLEGSRRAALPPGAGSLDRYLAPHALSLRPEVRCRLPRGPRLPFSRKVGLIALVVIASVAFAAFNYDGRQAQAGRKDQYLAEARVAIQQASTGTGDVESLLADADQTLELAARHGAAADQVAELQEQISLMRDARLGVARLSNIKRIGEIPSANERDAGRVVLASGTVYVVSGGAYLVDPESGSFERLLAPGEDVGNLTAGNLIDATVDEGRLVVSDGQNVFSVTSEGAWRAATLAQPAKGGVWDAAACGAFKGNFYLLAKDTPAIYKFDAGQYGTSPQPWLTGSTAEKFGQPVDMLVTDRITVLMANGTIESFYKGKVEATFVISPEPKGINEIAMFIDQQSDNMYVIQSRDATGELVRYNPSTQQVARFLAKDDGFIAFDAEALAAFNSATDFAVDEAKGMLYFVSGGELWSATLA